MPKHPSQIPLVNVFTPATGFGLPVIGNPRLNEKGLHLWRIALSDKALGYRRNNHLFDSPIATEIDTNGIAVVENFVPQEDFPQLRNEVCRTLDESLERSPVQGSDTERFGKKQFFDGGFDRYDGQTLNRFLDIDARRMPHSANFLELQKLRQCCEEITGTRFSTEKFQLYLTEQGAPDSNPDPQLSMHRDTFFSCIKLWYFLEDVAPEDGPFMYSPGSHKMTEKRLQWEKSNSIAAAQTNSGGSFRIDHEELARLDYPAMQSYPVPANTLVIADVRGFHARAAATRGNARRYSIYGNIRPWPFAPLRYQC